MHLKVTFVSACPELRQQIKITHSPIPTWIVRIYYSGSSGLHIMHFFFGWVIALLPSIPNILGGFLSAQLLTFMERPWLVAQHFSNNYWQSPREGSYEQSVRICFELMGTNFCSHFHERSFILRVMAVGVIFKNLGLSWKTSKTPIHKKIAYFWKPKHIYYNNPFQNHTMECTLFLLIIFYMP